MAENKLSKYTEEKDASILAKEELAREGFSRPVVDIYETEEGLVLLADLPGIEKDGLTIEVDQGLLTIEGRRTAAHAKQEGRNEFALRNFHRQFRLPDTIDSAASSAVLKNGLLTLKLPRIAAAKPKRIEVATVH